METRRNPISFGKKQLNDIMHQCFRKKKIQKDKKLLIESLLKKGNLLKLNFLSNSFPLRVIEI